MRKSVLSFLGIFILGLGLVPLSASPQLDVKMRVYEGTRLGLVEPPRFVTSSYIQPTLTANLQTGIELEKEKSQIKKVFNLQDVLLLTEADFKIGLENKDSARRYFRLNGNEYMVFLRLMEWDVHGRFFIVVNEGLLDKPKNVLTMEFLLIGGHSAVFGFEDRKGKPYFCSFQVTGPPEKLLAPPPPPPPAPPPAPAKAKKLVKFEEGAVKAVDIIPPPKPLRKAEPIYPEEARISGLEGDVVLNVRTDKKGLVKDVMIIKSTNETFNRAAAEAVRSWRYEPYLSQGKPKDLVFTVTLRFRLNQNLQGVVEAGGEIEPPEVLKRVEPVYPKIARQSGVQGVVILHVTTDEKGNVAVVEVLKSIPLLDQAAVDAVRKWKYQPFLHEGKPTPVSFTVPVRFRLK